MSRETRQKAQAKKQAAKKAAYDKPQEQREKSKYAKRVRARRNGAPMSDRSGEQRPWWDRGPGIPLSVQMAMFAARAVSRQDAERQAAA